MQTYTAEFVISRWGSKRKEPVVINGKRRTHSGGYVRRLVLTTQAAVAFRRCYILTEVRRVAAAVTYAVRELCSSYKCEWKSDSERDCFVKSVEEIPDSKWIKTESLSRSEAEQLLSKLGFVNPSLTLNHLSIAS